MADPNLDHDDPVEDLFEDQLACADLVVLNKADLLDGAALDHVGAALTGQLRPSVKLVRAAHGAIDASVLLGLAAAAEDDLDARPSHHDTEDDHDHDEFESFAVEFGMIDAPSKLLDRLAPLVADHDILRVKGFVAVAGRDMRLVVQGVGGRFDHYYDRDWEDDEPRASRLVVIGRRGLDRRIIEAGIRD
jgi:cobalamin biosynthesis protein CobW